MYLFFSDRSFDYYLYQVHIYTQHTDLSSTSTYYLLFRYWEKEGPSHLRVGLTTVITIANVKYTSGLIIINNYRADIKFPYCLAYVSFRLLNLNLIFPVHIS